MDLSIRRREIPAAFGAAKAVSKPLMRKGLKAIGLAMLYQSIRGSFRFVGGIIEDMGTGYKNYPFEKGITQGCSTGCYCGSTRCIAPNTAGIAPQKDRGESACLAPRGHKRSDGSVGAGV